MSIHPISTPIYCLSDNMITALGNTTTAHLQALRQGTTALAVQQLEGLPYPVCCATLPFYSGSSNTSSTRLEGWFIQSIQTALASTSVQLHDPDTLLILATTKGNIDALPDGNRISLNAMAQWVGQALGYWGTPVVVCNACTSGVLALDIAKRYLRAGHYRHAVVAGGDLVTPFVLSGFHALQAMSELPCRPFDRDRAGINLGEGVGTMVLSTVLASEIVLAGSASSNDANHISGPSRDGEGLYLAIQSALADARIDAQAIDYIGAHGTATLYNDEMEAQALERAGLTHVPLHSLKGYWGHTLGAAGLLESIIAVQALRQQALYPSFGFETLGVSIPLNIIKKHQSAPLHTCLKTSAGFGGCNAAIVFQKKP